MKINKLIYPFLLLNTLYANDYNKKLENFLNEGNVYREEIYEQVQEFSYKIDSFLTNDKKRKFDYDKSYILFESSLSQNQHENILFDNKLKLKIYLPKFREKFRLSFESEERKRKSQQFIENNSSKIDYDLVFSIKEKLQEHLALDAKLGLVLTSSKLNPFAKIKLSKEWPLKNRTYLLSQEFKQSLVKKFESTSTFSTTFPLKNEYSFLYKNEYYWHSIKENEDDFYTLFSIGKQLSDKNFISYNYSLNNNNKDNTNFKLKRYSFFLNFRHYVRKWLYLDVVPENFYREDLSFKARYAILFKLSILFGNK